MINYKAIQRAKRNELFLRGPVQFGWVRQNIPDPTSRLILVAEGFMGMSKPPASEVTLTGKLWNCAGIESADQRSRVLKKIDQRCEDYWVERRSGRTTVLHKRVNSKLIATR